MQHKKTIAVICIITIGTLFLSFAVHKVNDIPRLWDIEKLRSAHVPLVDKSIHVEPIAEELYYKIPERVAYKTYPLYMPGREPKGYYEWLLKQKPEIIFDASKIKSEDDWITAGEIIYDMPQNFQFMMDSSLDMSQLKIMSSKYSSVHMPVSKEGIIPFYSLAIREKGKIEVGSFSCGNCHNRVMPDGSVLKGGQGNFPFDDLFGGNLKARIEERKLNDSAASAFVSHSFHELFAAPWIKHESQEYINKPDAKHATDILIATVPGVMHRHSSILGSPTAIPDLFNLKERKYLDRTGLLLQRDIGDVMRYAVLNQEMDFTNSYGGFKPDDSPDSIIIKQYTRFSDAQAYALAKYLYTLKPMPNPEKASPELIARGKIIFTEETCVDCHTPPLYSSNKLTLADGYKPTKEEMEKYDVIDFSVRTDPGLAMYSRRGTGFYKVPSLLGVWNRSALMHSGYVTSLEEMFNAARQKDDFIPSGFNPNVDKPFAVKGHSFGLGLNAEDKKALITFLKSL